MMNLHRNDKIYIKVLKMFPKSVAKFAYVFYNAFKAMKRSSMDPLLLQRKGGWCKPERKDSKRVLEL